MFWLAGCSSASPSPSATSTPGGATTTAGTGAAPTSGSTGASGDTITIQNFAFSPATLTVSAGATVSVMNKDSTTHTVTAGDSPKSFNTGNIAANATVTFKAPSKPGTYAYSCTIHPFMHGTLTVQ